MRLSTAAKRGPLARSAAFLAALAGLLLVISVPDLLHEARDVDVLLYSAAAVRANAAHALPYTAAWIEKGPLAMGLYQTLFALFGAWNLAAVGAAWFLLVIAGAALARALARAAGARGVGGAWAAILFVVSIGAVGGTLNTEIPASVLAAASLLVWCGTLRTNQGRGGGPDRGSRERADPDAASPSSSPPPELRPRAAELLPGGSLASPPAAGPGENDHPEETAREDSRNGRPALALLAGALAAGAFLCRQNAGALAPLLIATEIALALSGRRSARGAALATASLAAGFAVVAGTAVAIYAAAGALEPFWFCFYGYNSRIYVAATRVDAARLLSSPLVAARNFLLPVRTAGALGLAGIAIALRGSRGSGAIKRGRSWRPQALVLAFAALGLTGSLFVGLRFFSHYFALVMPLWCALGGVAVERLAAGAARIAGARAASEPGGGSSFPGKGRGGSERSRARDADGNGPIELIRSKANRAGLGVAVLVALSLATEMHGRGIVGALGRVALWIRAGGVGAIAQPIGWPGADPLSARAAGFIRDHSGPTDRVFVWGMRPHICAYAGRVPATRFVTCTFLTGLVPWERVAPGEDTTRWIVPGSWDILMRDLEEERPLFIVDASQDHLFGMGAYAPSRYPLLAGLLDSRYERVFETGTSDRLVVWRRRADPSGKPG